MFKVGVILNDVIDLWILVSFLMGDLVLQAVSVERQLSVSKEIVSTIWPSPPRQRMAKPTSAATRKTGKLSSLTIIVGFQSKNRGQSKVVSSAASTSSRCISYGVGLLVGCGEAAFPERCAGRTLSGSAAVVVPQGAMSGPAH